MVRDLLQNKTAKEKAQIKSKEIAKAIKSIPKGKRGDIELEVRDIKEIDGGIQYFARAWDSKGNPIGFGKDGSVEWERFRVFNPRILVPDPAGDILQEWTDLNTGELKSRRLREDLEEALKQDLAHTIKLVGKSGKKIVKGKEGNTTSTFYPDTGTGSTTVDGYTEYRQNSGTPSWATVHDATDATSSSANAGEPYALQAGAWWNAAFPFLLINRNLMTFDTSAIPDTDSISVATLSVYLYGTAYTNSDDDTYNYLTVLASTQASNNSISNADYDAYGSTKLNTTDLVGSTASTSQYSDFGLNASGISNISKTGISKFGMKTGHDFDNVSTGFTGGASKNRGWNIYSADQAGTTNDPKLVVVHSVPSTAYSYSTTEVLSLSQSVAIQSSYNKTQLETLNLSQVVSPLSTFAQTISETLNLTENLSALKGFFETILEVLSLSDSKDVVSAFGISKTETLSLSELSEITKGLHVSILETINLSDSVVTAYSLGVVILETLNLSESLLKVGWDYVDKADAGTWTHVSKAASGAWTFINKREL